MENIWLVQSTKRLFSPWQLTLEVKRWQEGAASSNINISLSTLWTQISQTPCGQLRVKAVQETSNEQSTEMQVWAIQKIPPSNQSCQLSGHESLLLRLSLNLVGCRFRITFVRSNNWISHSQFIWVTHLVLTHYTRYCQLPCFAAHSSHHLSILSSAQTRLTCVMCDQCTLVSPPTLTGDPGQATAECEPRLAPAPAWELPSASPPLPASQLCQYLSWSTVNKYKPHLFLGATHSSSSVVSIAVIVSSEVMMDDGGFIGSDSEKERGGGPCYQFYCYDILRLPPLRRWWPLRLGDHYVRRYTEYWGSCRDIWQCCDIWQMLTSPLGPR